MNDKLQELTDLLSEIGQTEKTPIFSSSLSVEDMVITDVIAKNNIPIEIIYIDTGRLHHETYELMQDVKKHYKLNLKVFSPESSDLETYINSNGPNAFYQNVDFRKLCCHIRKILPIKRALFQKSLWITGLRKQQSVTRDELALYEWDNTFQIQKCNPLREWSVDNVWDYIYSNGVPYNKLHDQGYPSIGCEPCTRPVKAGEDIRAGRWWWESPESKECGLHAKAATQ